jgi:hypothetical protein
VWCDVGKIIWLASYPKSGNTWIRAFLANLFSGAEQAYDINELNRFCPTLTSRALYDAAAGGPTQDLSPLEVLKLRDAVQRALCANIPESAFIKTHSRFGARHDLPLIEPDCTAGAIYVVRNPLDVAVSAANHYGVSVAEMVRHMAEHEFSSAPTDKHVADYIGSWSMHVASWTMPAHPKIHVVRYEDLHAAPETAFARLVSFLGLEVPPEQVNRAISHSRFGSLAGQEQSAGFRERPDHATSFFRRGRPGEGRETLGPALVDAIVSAHSEQMARFGYLP